MSFGKHFKDTARMVVFSGNNWISLLGAALTTGSAFTMIWFWIMELTGSHAVRPYVGILIFLILPGFFAVGLGMMPLGIWLRRRRMRKAGQLPSEYPEISMAQRPVRHILAVIGIATFINVAILGTAGLKGVEYMDSNQFCGLTCHQVMIPEYTAFLDSPHSRVGCAQCHIGPGAGWFVKAKLSGTRQLFAVAFHTFSRPIPSPVEHLRPARETCEQCHWPEKIHGDKLLVRTKFAEDEANSPATTVLLLKIGGTTFQGKVGIHGRHLDNATRISYVSTDEKRQEIPKVIYTDKDGKVTEYVTEDFAKLSPEKLAKATTRRMDCVDCHNRPTHAFELPEAGLDRVIREGRISTALPFIKKVGLEALKASYATREEASAKISQSISDYYRTQHPAVYAQQRALIEAAAEGVKSVYMRNVFPDMKLLWGTHPNHIGHGGNDLTGGCFRCHDGNHKSADGKVITNDCSACHETLAMDEKDPKILKDLGTAR